MKHFAAQLFVMLFAGTASAPPQQTKNTTVLDGFRQMKLSADEIRAGSAFIDYNWFEIAPSGTGVSRAMRAKLDDLPWHGVFPDDEIPKTTLRIEFPSGPYADAKAGRAVICAALYASDVDARFAFQTLGSRIKGKSSPATIPAAARGEEDGIRVADIQIKDNKLIDLKDGIFFATGPWFVAVALEPDYEGHVDPLGAAYRAGRALREGPFVVADYYISLSKEIWNPGERLEINVFRGSFGCPFRDVALTEHLILKKGPRTLATVERPGLESDLRNGRDLSPETLKLSIPPGAEPGNYVLEIVMTVGEAQISRKAKFTIGN
ncbi:MAG: hypothetical protein HY286_07170 [Planctomycetes bacterium]|nr:hypothetical protein [Planctomycetota bacterium]